MYILCTVIVYTVALQDEREATLLQRATEAEARALAAEARALAACAPEAAIAASEAKARRLGLQLANSQNDFEKLQNRICDFCKMCLCPDRV